MRFTTLIEDSTRNEDLTCEHGLSLFIESNGATILFDTGQTGHFAENGTRLGINVGDVDFAVISHAHYDHGGGLPDFFRRNNMAPVYMHADAAQDYFGNIGAKLPLPISRLVHPLIKTSKTFSKYIGLDQALLADHAGQITFITETTEIHPNVFLMADIPQHHPLAEGNKYLLSPVNGKLEADRFSHEIIAVIREDDGLTLITGCGHGGIRNMVAAVDARFRGQPIKAVIGGFHLKIQPHQDHMAGTPQDIESIADAFIAHGIGAIYTGHCTGSDAYAILKSKLGERITPLTTGLTAEI